MNSSSFKEKPIVLLGLFFVLSLFINQAPHNLFTALFVASGLIFLVSNKKDSVDLISSERVFLGLIAAYAVVYSAINSYHFELSSKDLSYALKRLRWAPYSMIMVTTAILWTRKERTVPKNLKIFFLSTFTLISFLIFYDSITRVIFNYPSASLWFKSNSNNLFGNRASWTYNPIPFSKISFLAFLISGLGYIRTKDFKFKVLFLGLSVSFAAVSFFSQTRATW